MRLIKSEINGVKFYYRDGYSDLKTFEEVLNRDSYQRKGFHILEGEHWMDCGANVGAFSLLAKSKNAEVTAYEPDPFNCEMIEKNAKLNNFKVDIVQAALVAENDLTEALLYVGNNGNVWRNSLFKKWNNKGLKVDCLAFEKEAARFGFCKMDIEGAEMSILESTSLLFKKLVYEWSFDVDPSLTRFWAVIDKHFALYDEVMGVGNAGRYKTRDYNVWQGSWFPPCVNVFCKKV